MVANVHKPEKSKVSRVLFIVIKVRLIINSFEFG